MAKVLVVDDSAFMRKILSDLFNNAADFEVVDTARNGKDAIEKIRTAKPDLITLDIDMPVMDGLTALEIIMKENPLPVIMISSLTQVGADATIKALSLGAVDFIRKKAGAVFTLDGQEQTILEKCRGALKANLKRNTTYSPPEKKLSMSHGMRRTPVNTFMARSSGIMNSGNDKIVAIGTSTGGPRALQHIIPLLPGDFPCGIVIVQHMPPGFTKSLADRLNSMSQVSVKEAEDGDVILPGKVFIAPGDYHMVVVRSGNNKVIKLNQNPRVGNHRPAVDVLFQSVAAFGRQVIAVILTGMGADGSKGMKYIKDNGGYSIGESESTAIVYGMPKVAADLGLIDKVLPVDKVAAELIQQVKK